MPSSDQTKPKKLKKWYSDVVYVKLQEKNQKWNYVLIVSITFTWLAYKHNMVFLKGIFVTNVDLRNNKK